VAVTGDVDTQAAYYCAASLVRRRTRTGEPIPAWLRQHHAGLDAEIRGMSRRGHEGGEIGPSSGQLEVQTLIGTKEAARLLSWSTKKVERHRRGLGGQLVSGRLIFDRSKVLEYARRIKNGRSPSGA
jgi:hypothetical protein